VDCGATYGFNCIRHHTEWVVSGDGVSGSCFGEERGWCFCRLCERVSNHVDDGCYGTNGVGFVGGDVDVVDVVVGFAVVEWWIADYGLQG
jgi:hypothetical protein